MTPKQISSIVYQIIPITSRPVPSRWGTRRLEGTEHLGVLKNSLKRVRAFQIELEFENVGFKGEGKTELPGEKPLGTRERTNNKLNLHMASTPGFEPAGGIAGRRA